MLRTCLDHDIQVAGAGLFLQDFQVSYPSTTNYFYISKASVTDFFTQLTKLMFPFIDLLGDGYSSFTYLNNVLITETNDIALSSILNYGQTPVPATFSPLLEAYQWDESRGKKELTFSTFAAKETAFETHFQPQPTLGPWPLLNLFVPLSLSTFHRSQGGRLITASTQLQKHDQPTLLRERHLLPLAAELLQHHALHRPQRPSWYKRRRHRPGAILAYPQRFPRCLGNQGRRCIFGER